MTARKQEHVGRTVPETCTRLRKSWLALGAAVHSTLCMLSSSCAAAVVQAIEKGIRRKTATGKLFFLNLQVTGYCNEGERNESRNQRMAAISETVARVTAVAQIKHTHRQKHDCLICRLHGRVKRERTVPSLGLHWFHFCAAKKPHLRYIPSTQNQADTQMQTRGRRRTNVKANNGILPP